MSLRTPVSWSCAAVLVVAVAHASVPATSAMSLQTQAQVAAAVVADAALDAAATRTPVAPSPVPLLWKISAADADPSDAAASPAQGDADASSLYLLGSFHLLKPADYPLSADVDAAFADAESLLFELPPQEMVSPQLGLQMGQAALRTDGTTLDSELPPATARKLQSWFADNASALQAAGMAPAMLQMFEPWFVGLTVSIVGMTGHGLQPELGLDQHFAAAAQQAGKPTAGLETGAQQIAFLDGMDQAEQLQLLDEALTDADSDGAELEKLHAAWRAGDVATLWNGMAADMQREYPQLYRHVNVERNDAWLPVLEQRLQADDGDDTLVVVGALHLLGSDGVVEKLRAKGYRVERICSACAP